jgi:hypothetical protein
MKSFACIGFLILASLMACAPQPPVQTPTVTPGSVSSPAPSTNPSSAPSTAPSTPPLAPVEVSIQAETATRILAEAKFPRSESRGATGKVFVMMFSGGDAGSSASLELPVLQGRYKVSMNYLNHPDSPEFKLDFADKHLLLPAGTSENTDGALKIKDLGVMDLSVPAGSRMLMTVGGNIRGKENAWIGVDYFTFTPVL